MFEIKGKYATAICYASVVENEAIEQIRRMCDHEFTAGSRIRIMPDVHSGVGCTIGTTMTIVNKVVPNIVGVDIGCGMYTVELGKVVIDFERVDEAAHYIQRKHMRAKCASSCTAIICKRKPHFENWCGMLYGTVNKKKASSG